MTTRAQVVAALVPCGMPNSDGGPCGQSGVVGLPAGVCLEHALTVYRAVSKLIGEHLEAAEQRRRPPRAAATSRAHGAAKQQAK